MNLDQLFEAKEITSIGGIDIPPNFKVVRTGTKTFNVFDKRNNALGKIQQQNNGYSVVNTKKESVGNRLDFIQALDRLL